jgi:hypothetical protein
MKKCVKIPKIGADHKDQALRFIVSVSPAVFIARTSPHRN